MKKQKNLSIFFLLRVLLGALLLGGSLTHAEASNTSTWDSVNHGSSAWELAMNYVNYWDQFTLYGYVLPNDDDGQDLKFIEQELSNYPALNHAKYMYDEAARNFMDDPKGERKNYHDARLAFLKAALKLSEKN